MTKEVIREMYQLLLTEPHAPTVCSKLERIARDALAQPEQEPTNDWSEWRGMVVQNLMRHGIDKDFARRLAHFYQDKAPQRKPLTDRAAMFAAQHKFLEWNRQQDECLVKVAYEYGVFQKAIELYNEAAHGIIKE